MRMGEIREHRAIYRDYVTQREMNANDRQAVFSRRGGVVKCLPWQTRLDNAEDIVVIGLTMSPIVVAPTLLSILCPYGTCRQVIGLS